MKPARWLIRLEEFEDAMAEVNERVKDLQYELMKSLEASFGVKDADIEQVTSWYVEMLGANEEAEKLSEQLQTQVIAAKMNFSEREYE